MSTKRTIYILLVGMMLVAWSIGAEAAPKVCDYEGCTWLATGTVTKIDGATFFLLGKDSVVYTVRAGQAEVVVEDYTTDCYSLAVGDLVRVYGVISGPSEIRAERLRIFTRQGSAMVGAGPEGTRPESEVKIIIERPPSAQAPAPDVAEPQPTPAPAPAVQAQPATWEGRGLITDIDYTGRVVKLRSSEGQFSISVGRAQLIHGSRAIGLGRLNLGDTVRVVGNLSGLNQVDAQQLVVLRTRSEAENALPQRPISVAGVIQQIDYPSFTFTMTTESTPIVVMADANTVVQSQMKRWAFMDLKPGMKVKMSGYGSLGTGFAAQHIQVISIAP